MVMQLRQTPSTLEVGELPAKTATVRFFLNGVQCLSVAAPSGTGRLSVPLESIDAGARGAIPTTSLLLQCYALDLQGNVLAVTQQGSMRLGGRASARGGGTGSSPR